MAQYIADYLNGLIGTEQTEVRAALLAAAGLPAPYTGLVATRCGIMDNANASTAATFYNARTQHVARDTITSLQLLLKNWYLNYGAANAEANNPGTATVSCTIEYPASTFTRVNFSASANGSIATGANLLSDVCTVAIPKGAVFWVRTWYRNASGVPYIGDLSGGNYLDQFEFGTGSGTDKTATGTIARDAASYGGFPLAILATTSRASLWLCGDSHYSGFDAQSDDSYDQGIVARSLGPFFAYANTGQPSERATQFISTHAKRMALLPYVTHVMLGYGANDLFNARTAAQILADLKTIVPYFTGKKVLTNTIIAATTSSDSWATVANQTVATSNAARITVNKALRAGLDGCDGVFDIANAVESGLDSGKLMAAPAITADGIHVNQLGALIIKKAAVVNPALFVR